MFTLVLDIPYVNRYYLICEEEYQERMIPKIKQYLENRFSLPFEIIRIEKVTKSVWPILTIHYFNIQLCQK